MFFKLSPSIEIVTTPQGLAGAAKVLNLTPHANKLDKCLMKGYPIFSILKN